jgi:ABC-type phosphate transport system auxiliary subunit
MTARSSDRWVTPGVVCVGIITVGLVVLGVAGLVAYLAARGIDPAPVLDLTAKVATAAGSLGTLTLQLVSRRTVAKTERNTGLLTSAVWELSDSLPSRPPVPQPVPRHAAHGAALAPDRE